MTQVQLINVKFICGCFSASKCVCVCGGGGALPPEFLFGGLQSPCPDIYYCSCIPQPLASDCDHILGQ